MITPYMYRFWVQVVGLFLLSWMLTVSIICVIHPAFIALLFDLIRG